MPEAPPGRNAADEMFYGDPGAYYGSGGDDGPTR